MRLVSVGLSTTAALDETNQYHLISCHFESVPAPGRGLAFNRSKPTRGDEAGRLVKWQYGGLNSPRATCEGYALARWATADAGPLPCLGSALTESHTMQTEENRFLRLPQIIGCADRGLPPIIPVSRTTWFVGVKAGRFPQPVRLGPRVTAWRASEIYALIEAAK